MAIFNLTASIGSRAGGPSASAKFDYIAREGKYARGGDELREKESGNMPSWAAESPREYWAAADEYERANGRLYREVHVALPVELDAGEQRALARRLAQDLTAAERLPYSLAIHDGEGRNPHAHVMWSERGNDGHDRSAETWFKRANSKEPARGGARKSRVADSRDWLPGLREQWAARVNDGLKRVGREERVDHRRLAVRAVEALERGDEDLAAELVREPNIHLGPAAVQSIERQAQGEPPMREIEEAAEVERRNDVWDHTWAAISRQCRQLREHLIELRQQLLELTREIRQREREREAKLRRELEWALDRARDHPEPRSRPGQPFALDSESLSPRPRLASSAHFFVADLGDALREHEVLVKAGRHEDAGRLEEQVIDEEIRWGGLNRNQDAKDRYDAVSELRLRDTPNVTNADINRVVDRIVAERVYDRDRDYGRSR